MAAMLASPAAAQESRAAKPVPAGAKAKKQAAPPAKAAAKAAPSKGQPGAKTASKAAAKPTSGPKAASTKPSPSRKKAPAAAGKALEVDEALAGEKIGGGKNSRSKKAPAAPASKQRPQRTASTQPVGKSKPGSKKRKPEPPCFRPKIELMRGFHRSETESLALTYCDGKPAPNAIEMLSLLARPNGAPRPKKLPNTPPPTKASAKGAKSAKGKKGKAPPVEAKPAQGNEWAPGVKLVDEGLVTRLQKVIDHFKAKRVWIISGYRPQSDRSFHQSAKALDFRLDGVRNEELVAFCRTLTDTGCGYYPNSSFVHMDVRPPKTGHVYWIDASGPGETPRYVSSWPPKEKPEPGDDVVLDPNITGESAPSEAITSRKSRAGKAESADDDDSPSLLEALGADMAKGAEVRESPVETDSP